MAKAWGRRLKVFQAQFGFYDTVVAASSQAGALRAWGVHQNLFADGQAHVTNDALAVAAALAHPETPLRRAVGSSDPFAVEPASLPKIPDAPRKKQISTSATRKAKPEPLREPRADRSALDAAEAALRSADEDRKQEEAKFRRRQDELDAARATAQSKYVDRRKTATAAVANARQAYRKAGGKD